MEGNFKILYMRFAPFEIFLHGDDIILLLHELEPYFNIHMSPCILYFV